MRLRSKILGAIALLAAPCRLAMVADERLAR